MTDISNIVLNKLLNINIDFNMSPQVIYDTLDISNKNPTLSELRLKIKPYLLITHPDKSGSKEIFQYINKLYKICKEDIKNKDAQYRLMQRQEECEDAKELSAEMVKKIKNISLDEFNKIWEETNNDNLKIKKKKIDNRFKVNKKLSNSEIKKIQKNPNQFNNFFNKEIKKEKKLMKKFNINQDIVKFNIPNGKSKLHYIIGETYVDDYSSPVGEKIKYTDFEKAFSHLHSYDSVDVPTKKIEIRTKNPLDNLDPELVKAINRRDKEIQNKNIIRQNNILLRDKELMSTYDTIQQKLFNLIKK